VVAIWFGYRAGSPGSSDGNGVPRGGARRAGAGAGTGCDLRQNHQGVRHAQEDGARIAGAARKCALAGSLGAGAAGGPQVSCIGWNCTGQKLASGAADNICRVWGLDKGVTNLVRAHRTQSRNAWAAGLTMALRAAGGERAERTSGQRWRSQQLARPPLTPVCLCVPRAPGENQSTSVASHQSRRVRRQRAPCAFALFTRGAQTCSSPPATIRRCVCGTSRVRSLGCAAPSTRGGLADRHARVEQRTSRA
jgi:hypothetical protein